MTIYASITDRIRTKNPGLSDPEVRQLVKQEIRRRKHRRELINKIACKIICGILYAVMGICAFYAFGGIVMMLLNCFILV